jgi:hypothetical protein
LLDDVVYDAKRLRQPVRSTEQVSVAATRVHNHPRTQLLTYELTFAVLGIMRIDLHHDYLEVARRSDGLSFHSASECQREHRWWSLVVVCLVFLVGAKQLKGQSGVGGQLAPIVHWVAWA